MPWTAGDVDSKYKGLTKKQKEVWLSVANAALKAGDDEALAIKKANAVVNRMKKTEAFAESRDVLLEVGKMISNKNMETIHSSLNTMQQAMEQLRKLVAADDAKVDEAWSLEEAGKILAQDDSYDATRGSVQAALRLRAQNKALEKKLASGGMGYDDEWYYSCYPYIRDLYDEYVVYSLDRELYQCSYTDNDGVVTLGDEIPVQVSYVPIEKEITNMESGPNLGNIVRLQEKAVNNDGVVQIKLISPGWGSSGYYSEKVLQRDGPKVFKRGLHMYINHPTEEEDTTRPERDLKDLAGVLEEDAKYDKNGPTGPGLYAPAKVLSPYKDFIDEAAPYIGTSIRASGKAIEGQAEGRYGMIIEGLVDGYSVDYVTLPGRGGEVLPLLEAARTKIERRRDVVIEEHSNKDIEEMDEAKVQELIEASLKGLKDENVVLKTKLDESNTQLSRMTEALILREAKDVVISTLSSIELPEMTRNRLAESCAKSITLKEDGSLDREKLVEVTKEAAIAEMTYINSVAGISNGKPVGVGASGSKEVTAEEADKILENAFKTLGFSESATKIAVSGRN